MAATGSGGGRGVALGTFAVCALAAAVALHPLIEPDVFWHLASGRWILEHGHVPHGDPFSWVSPGSPWVNLQWLFDVGLVSAWTWGGPDALVLGKAVALAALAALWLRGARAGGAAAAPAIAAAALATLAAAERTTVRPEILTTLMLALFVLLVERARRGAARRELAALPVLAALWINLHALAFLGALFIVWHAVLAAAEARWPKAMRAEPLPKHLPRDLALAGVGCVAALLANPYGIAAWTFPATLFRRVGTGPAVFARILEFTPPWQTPADPALRFFWILLGVTGVVFLLRVRTFAWSRLLAWLPFLVLALMARRNLPLFATVAAPALAVEATHLGRAVSVRGARVASLVVLGVAVAVLRGASPSLLGLPRERGLGVLPGLFPEDCLAAADRQGLRGRLLNDLDFGGYVAWRDPERKTFLDGRLEVAGPERLEEFIAAHEDPSAWQRLCATWHPELLLLQHASRGSAAFLRAQLDGGAWRAVCWSPEAALLVRADLVAGAPVPDGTVHRSWSELLGETRGPAPYAGHALDGFSLPLDRWLRPDPAPSAIRRAARWANLQLTLDHVSGARAGYEAILAVAPNDSEALFNRGLCALHAGHPEEARSLWEEALPRVDRGSRPLFRRALDERVR